MARALLVIRHPTGMQIFVNDHKVANEFIKSLSLPTPETGSSKSTATERRHPHPYQRKSSLSKYSTSPQENATMTSTGDSFSETELSSDPHWCESSSLQVPVKNTFVHDISGTKSSSGDSCCSSPPGLMTSDREHAHESCLAQRCAIPEFFDLCEATTAATQTDDCGKSFCKLDPACATDTVRDFDAPIQASFACKNSDAKVSIQRVRPCSYHGDRFDRDCTQCTMCHCQSCTPKHFCKRHRKDNAAMRLCEQLCEQYGIT